MTYTTIDIKNALWNTFKYLAKDIVCVNEFTFKVVLEDSIMAEDAFKLFDELYDSDLFDIKNNGEYFIVTYVGLDESLMTYNTFRMLNENTKYVEFSDANVAYYTKLYNTLHVNIRSTPYFKTLWNTYVTKKRLTMSQWHDLEYTLKNGGTRYNQNKLSTKY